MRGEFETPSERKRRSESTSARQRDIGPPASPGWCDRSGRTPTRRVLARSKDADLESTERSQMSMRGGAEPQVEVSTVVRVRSLVHGEERVAERDMEVPFSSLLLRPVGRESTSPPRAFRSGYHLV